LKANNKVKLFLISRTILPWNSGSAWVIDNLAKAFSKSEMIVFGGKGLFRPKYKTASIDYRYATTEFNLFGRGARFFRLIRWFTLPYLVFKLWRLIQSEKVTHIISVFPDIFYCIAAYIVSKVSSIPFYLYMHNTYLENRKGLNLILARWVQPKLFKNSNKIFCISDGLTNYYRKHYSEREKFITINHSFANYPKMQNQIQKNGKITKFVLIGNFNNSNFDATKRIIEVIDKIPFAELHVFSQLSLNMMKYRGLDLNSIIHHGPLINNPVQTIRNYDYAILTHGFEGKYSNLELQTIFPTRTIPLLLSQKPIILLAPKDSFLHSFFLTNNCGFIIDDRDPFQIQQQVQKILTTSYEEKELITVNALRVADQFYGPKIRQKLINQL